MPANVKTTNQFVFLIPIDWLPIKLLKEEYFAKIRIQGG